MYREPNSTYYRRLDWLESTSAHNASPPTRVPRWGGWRYVGDGRIRTGRRAAGPLYHQPAGQAGGIGCFSNSDLPNRLIAADVAQLEAQGRLLAAQRAVPKGFCPGAIQEDETVFVDLDLAVGMPRALGGGAVGADVLDELQPALADRDRLVRLFGAAVLPGLLVEGIDLLQDAVTDKGVNGNAVPAARVAAVGPDMERDLVPTTTSSSRVLRSRSSICTVVLSSSAIKRRISASSVISI